MNKLLNMKYKQNAFSHSGSSERYIFADTPQKPLFIFKGDTNM
jgi:hypothetical protein